MATRLVDHYGAEYARFFADRILPALPAFDRDGFVSHMAGVLGEEGLLARQDLYVDALEHYLSLPYEDTLSLFTLFWGEELQQDSGMFKEGWWLWPLGRYVERHGLKNPEASYRFLHGFTKRQTGEFAIRPLLIKNTRETMLTLQAFSRDENVHVRRLASEGLRISLPWAQKTVAALFEFEIYADILGHLKDDPSRFVQKSVGNNLNDLYKFDSKLAKMLVSSWETGELTAQAAWVLRHGQRSLRKKGEQA